MPRPQWEGVPGDCWTSWGEGEGEGARVHLGHLLQVCVCVCVCHVIYLLACTTVHREPDISVLDKDGLKVSFSVNPSSTLTNTVVTMTATNSTQQPISEFLFQAAVPKVRKHNYYVCCVCLFVCLASTCRLVLLIP